MARATIREGEYRRFRAELGEGMLAAVFEGQRLAQADAPVRGGHRSFDPGGPVGGTLRRSAWADAWVDGRKVGGSGEPGPSASRAGRGIVGRIGFSAFYALFVELGTVLMPARPYLLPAARRVADQLGGFLRRATRA